MNKCTCLWYQRPPTFGHFDIMHTDKNNSDRWHMSRVCYNANKQWASNVPGNEMGYSITLSNCNPGNRKYDFTLAKVRRIL